MKIKTQFVITMALFGLILVLIALSMVGTARQVAELDEHEDAAIEVARGANELGTLTDDYLIHLEDVQRSRWESKWAAVMGDLDRLTPEGADQRAVIDDIRSNLRRAKAVFTDIERASGGSSETGPVLSSTFFETSWSRMALQTQAVVSDAGRLSRMLRDQKAGVQRQTVVLIAALLGVFGAYFVTVYAIVYRRALGSIAKLHEGTRVVGSGDLDFKIKVPRDDEIGRLARAFNRMTADLKKVTASKGELEREIAERERAERQVLERGERLRLASGAAELGVFEWDILSGVANWENDRMYEIFGRARSEGAADIDTFLADYIHHEDREDFERALAEGMVPQGTFRPVVRIRPGRDGAWRWVEFSGTFEAASDGSPRRLVGVLSDVTEREQAERLNKALHDIRSEVTSTFDIDEVVTRLALLGMAALGADSAAFARVAQGRWSLDQVYGNAEAELGAIVADTQRFAPANAAQERHPLTISDSQDGGSQDPYAERIGARALLIVPVIAHGRAHGAASFHYSHPTVFSKAELDFATGLMNAATLALDNARAYQRERTIADTLQEALLPPAVDIPGIETASLYRPASKAANVGGDFYDLFQLDGEQVLILVGDVSGKGLQAARLTSLLRDGVLAYACWDRAPDRVLERLNELVFRVTPAESFATLFLGVLDVPTGSLRYCAAGHPPAAMIRANSVDLISRTGGPLVGAFSDAVYRTHETELTPGDVLVLYTDGITEARRDGELFGQKRLVAALGTLRDAPVSELPQALLQEVIGFSGGELRDDTVILCVSMRASS